ncbi:aminoglycoside 6'-N-acetyltransferase I [Anaerosporobacter mobilis DSM 15930]|jgi:aminoglycoside 6'-N-acetyltransferase I|uniref:Aminoglycoside N(6')-acetyltransferase type 1 n=1 Tax=Anaerosporobacter mobilis DSM 15930 TaxID=1120996 RepID=A0A1M7GLP7_9FIRM|nr:aminoglycoside 6'-N-acetyltransferase [Anaerosporobacter mobilis]SHM17322.1 aminoglycoside 6'-N-acetyltransferase I [Anaerosporobacter mobilis DSM 15930]
MIKIHKAILSESKIVTELFIRMWEDHNLEELQQEFEEDIASDESSIFLAYFDELPVAVAQCRLRKDYVEGTCSSPVGYLEGIYVEQEYRKQGIAKLLCKECENWAKEKGCEEFASDCELSNETSLKFHLRIGFDEVNRIICFTKKLSL